MSDAALIIGKVCSDHIYKYVAIPSKLSKSKFMTYAKEKSACMLFDRHLEFRRKYGSRKFWARGYHVATMGSENEGTIVKYIRAQEENDKSEK